MDKGVPQSTKAEQAMQTEQAMREAKEKLAKYMEQSKQDRRAREAKQLKLENQIEKAKREKQGPETKQEMRPEASVAPNRRGNLAFRIVRAFVAILVSVAVMSCAAGAAYVYSIIKDAPQIDTKNIKALLPENSVIYDSKGNVIDSVFLESKSTNVSYADLPENLKDAVIAIEDKTFWEHHGFNLVRIVGAVVESLKTGQKISGTSTITQQLARNLYLADTKNEYSFKRKVIEAYYAVILERDLTKEQILEAYMNRIPLGFGTRGVEAASQGYFSKDVEDLNLPECVALAAITQEPQAYSLIKTLPNASVADDNANILFRGPTYAYLYNAQASAARRATILGLMLDQGYITSGDYNAAITANLRDYINPSIESENNETSYFNDYAIKEVVADLVSEYGVGEDAAWDMLFNGGLKIYSTVDQSLQDIIESEFSNNENFPGIANLIRDKSGNILKPGGGVLLYNYDNFFDAAGNFTIAKGEYDRLENGDVLLRVGKKLNFYRTEVNGAVDYSVNFKSMYVRENGALSTINEGTIAIPAEYKDKDELGDLIIEAKFFEDYPGFFTETDAGLVVSAANYSINQKVIQPQGAMVILDYTTGEIKAMAGGRGTVGRLLYNRAVNPRQPGSSIKPISVYGPALQSAADDVSGRSPYSPQPYLTFTPEMSVSGKYWTAASVINDAPIFFNEKPWPKNWYAGNRGPATLRTSIQQSINVNAVKVFSRIGPERSLDFLKKVGVSTVVETGSVNDINPAALALGGMTTGISPMEMAGAYGTFANGGAYNKPVAYTKVVDRYGKVLLENIPENRMAMDPGVAFIMTDILRTTVTSGIAARAAVKGRTVAGKTGTTTDNYDAWFVGITPEYAASLWIGNDVNIELNEGSMAAARLWSKIMTRVLSETPEKEFKPMPADVVSAYGEYFIAGTQDSSIVEIMPPPPEEESPEAGADGTEITEPTGPTEPTAPAENAETPPGQTGGGESGNDVNQGGNDVNQGGNDVNQGGGVDLSGPEGVSAPDSMPGQPDSAQTQPAPSDEPPAAAPSEPPEIAPPNGGG